MRLFVAQGDLCVQNERILSDNFKKSVDEIKTMIFGGKFT
jgi:hypothetical protein